MKNLIKLLILTYIFLTIMINGGSAFPDLLFILVIGGAMILDPIPALIFGSINGLFLDFLNPQTLGINTLLLTISSYVAIRINAIFFQKLTYRYFFLIILFTVISIVRSSSIPSVLITIAIMVPTLYLIQTFLTPAWKTEK